MKDQQTPAPVATDIVNAPVPSTFAFNRTVVAALAGSAASPNLPYGQWSFVATTDGSEPLLKEEASARSKNADGSPKMVKFYQVYPTGNNKPSLYRRVYPMALATDSAGTLLFPSGELVKSAAFGIFQTTNGSMVSGDPTQVAAGIAQAQLDYTAKREKEDANKVPKAELAKF